MKNILLVDTSALLHKSKHTLSGKLSYKDADTGILYGFLSQFGKLCNKYQTNNVVFALDSKKSKRKAIYPEYRNKRNDNKTETEISFDKYCYERFDETIEIIRDRLGFPNVWEESGYEADDIIATFIKSEEEFAKRSIIVSSDNDYFQLLHLCKGMHTSKDSLYTARLFMGEWGINPKDWVKVKKIAGCSGDNVKSVPRVRYKTAVNYLKGTCTDKIRDLIESEEMRPVKKLSGRLTKLPFDDKILLPDFIEPKLDFDVFLQMCSEFGFNSIISDSDRYRMWERIFNGKFLNNQEKKENKKRASF